MAFVAFTIDTKEAVNLFDSIKRNKNAARSKSNFNKALSNSIKKTSASKKRIVNISAGKANDNPLTKSLTGDLFNSNNLVNNTSDVLVATNTTKSFQDLSINNADLAQKDFLDSKVRKKVKSNKTKIVSELLNKSEVIEALKTISFPITLSSGQSFGIVASDVVYNPSDFNLRVVNTTAGEGTVNIAVELSLSKRGFNKILKQIQQSINTDKLLLNFRNNYKTEEAFIGAILALKSSNISLGITDFGTRINIAGQTQTEEDRSPSMLMSASAIFQRLITTVPEEELVRRIRGSVAMRMPKGPPNGKITQPNILTYRTGSFVRSIEIFYDRKFEAVKYYYAPNYYAHEDTGRDPRDLIEGSISRIIQRAVGGQARIFKVGF